MGEKSPQAMTGSADSQPLDMGQAMKVSELRRRLQAQGATFVEGGRHTKVYLSGRQSVIPRHPAHELPDGTRRAILKQLGLKASED